MVPMKHTVIPAVMLSVLSFLRAGAGGMLLPLDRTLPPLAIEYQRVHVEVRDAVARTTVKQAFRNSLGRRLEATYVFPLPRGAGVTDFAMIVNGRKVRGEILERRHAAELYRDIVRRMRDPGLLEYMGGGLFRARVYPVPAHGLQKIEIHYSQTVQYQGGVACYVYPLRTGERASRTLKDFTISAVLHSREPIKTVYSPSHDIDVRRRGEHEADVGFEGDRQRLDKDFVLYWTVSEKDVGVNLICHRSKGEDGFFLAMIAPDVRPDKGKVYSQDVVFVIDTSGSMASANKIGQVKAALEYCLRRLRPGDRFDIVRFSTDVEPFRKSLVAADKAAVQAALAYVDRFQARGGTNIEGALSAALAMRPSGKRPFVVVFLTDGLPTVGVTRPDRILARVRQKNGTGVRVFCFGVGYDVNTHLLDRLAEVTRATSQYVKPGESIEMKVSLFFDQVSQPVLTSPELDFGKVQVADCYPNPLPDVFKGSRILVFGRYRNAGDTAIVLRGMLNGKKRKFTYEGQFPAVEPGNDFIPKLWATRKIGYLLDQIRLHGETRELRDEVVRLSREYGVVTPYTSFVAVPDRKTPQVSSRNIPGRPLSRPYAGPIPGGRRRRFGGFGRPGAIRPLTAAGGPGGSAGRPRGIAMKSVPAGPAPMAFEAADSAAPAPAALPFRAQTGAAAVNLSRFVARLKSAGISAAREGTPQSPAAGVRAIAGKVFYRRGDAWVDSKYRAGMKTLSIRWGSDAYFRLIELRPGLKPWLMLGNKVVIVLAPDLALQIGEKGLEHLSAGDVRKIRK